MTRGGLALALLLPVLAGAATGVPPADPDWHIPVAADSGEPAHPDFLRLSAALASYERLEQDGGWPGLPADATLAPGTRDVRVVQLRDRLRASGDFTPGTAETADAWFFDGALYRSLQGFQARHGLPVTGALDEATIAAANVPVAERIAQLRTTLQRWRWLPREFGPRYLWANVPGGMLEMIEARQSTLSLRIIAGHPDRPTPSFEDIVSGIVFNPAWSVPRTIAVEDLLPTQQEDPTFLSRLDIRVHPGGDPDGPELDPAGIDWQKLSADYFPYRLRQMPGPLNSLGRFKFVMGNPWDIYLHDTPSRRLFDLRSRTLSSGCLRIDRPEELVDRLLAGQPRPAGLETGATQTVSLQRPIRVYVVYLTNWVTPEGVVHFRPDVYGRDTRLRATGRGLQSQRQ